MQLQLQLHEKILIINSTSHVHAYAQLTRARAAVRIPSSEEIDIYAFLSIPRTFGIYIATRTARACTNLLSRPHARNIKPRKIYQLQNP